nr:hypothetical protein B0A51_16540 [Rachicladosporium sp. CCFEE 5018]OQO18543.1 hypothetical protein B0A51_15139 [Rachicladosporium sp. CCFEE 5018]OQO26683.1 hypothetical protein B0A51_07683 [Rachicladosporium sp. CCFEE 5018]OQO30411.1 hypothetical protein B0A51_03041 [Rachicladosporium sp. CCFEE 5018]
MATTETTTRPAERPTKHRPFAAWVKRFTNSKKAKKGSKNGVGNNPYPESGFVRQHSPRSSHDGQLSIVTPASNGHTENGSMLSGHLPDKDGRSAAPTVATNPDTVHSRAYTSTTGGGAVSSTDAGNNSTFSSPNQSERSLTTTLTTIQSMSPANTLQNAASAPSHGSGGPVMFSHQYPVSPAPSHLTQFSAIPRHLTADNRPTGDSNSTVLTDDASIMTLASSSKRRRRSMESNASMRALAPNSLWGNSRESLPLSVLSGTADASSPSGGLFSSRPSIGGIASAERASVYSSQGVAAPAIASKRNSYYQRNKDLSDGKSLRSINNLDSRSQYDAKSMTDARSMHEARNADVASLRNYEGSVRSGALGHGRNDSIPGSIGSPLASPLIRHASTSGALSRRSSDWQRETIEDDDSHREALEKVVY